MRPRFQITSLLVYLEGGGVFNTHNSLNDAFGVWLPHLGGNVEYAVGNVLLNFRKYGKSRN